MTFVRLFETTGYIQMDFPTKAEIAKLPRVRIPSRGKWIAARAAYHREAGLRHMQAITEATTDWDEGRFVGNWQYEKYAK